MIGVKKVIRIRKIAQTVALGRTEATKIVKQVVEKAHSEELTDILISNIFLINKSNKSDIETVYTCVRHFDRVQTKLLINFGISFRFLLRAIMTRLMRVLPANDCLILQKGLSRRMVF